jgi:hypothetical protein
MNPFRIGSGAERPPFVAPTSEVTNALLTPEVQQAFRSELAPRIQAIQREHPDLIFPLRKDEMDRLILVYQECALNGSCLPDEVDDRIAENLRILKEGRTSKKID